MKAKPDSQYPQIFLLGYITFFTCLARKIECSAYDRNSCSAYDVNFETRVSARFEKFILFSAFKSYLRKEMNEGRFYYSFNKTVELMKIALK